MKNNEYEIRIEVKERFVANLSELEYLEDLGISTKEKQIVYKYRRTNPRLEDIERVLEIPGNDKECVLRLYSGEEIYILENFDGFCIKMNDLWNGEFESE